MNDSEVNRFEETRTPVGAKLDAVGWGLFLIWVGTALFVGVGWPAFFLGVGLIMLGGQAARSYFGVKLDWFAIVLGSCFAAGGGLRALDVQLGEIVTPAWLLPSAFIAAGVAIVLSAWRRREPRT